MDPRHASASRTREAEEVMDQPPKENPLRPGTRLCAPDLATAESCHYEICTDDHAEREDHKVRYVAHVLREDATGVGYVISQPKKVRRTYFRRHIGKHVN